MPLKMDATSDGETQRTKRLINHRLKQIETRIQRQIVIEDGKVISDSGPLITTKTQEDIKENIEEFEEKCSNFKPQATPPPSSSSCSSCRSESPVSETSSKPKPYMFGFDDQSFASARLRSKNRMMSTKPSKYFYFGQKSNKLSAMNGVPNNSPTTRPNRLYYYSDINNNNNHCSSDDGDAIEQDCQYDYHVNMQNK